MDIEKDIEACMEDSVNSITDYVQELLDQKDTEIAELEDRINVLESDLIDSENKLESAIMEIRAYDKER